MAMARIIRKSSLYVVVWIVLFFLPSCVTVGIETPKYKVIEKEGQLEIRRYPPQIVAETIVQADFDQSGNLAFRRLYKYISGRNRTKQSIAMTAPVNQKTAAQKIPMTAPVTQQKVKENYAVSFLMPAEYSLETLPEPLDPNVILKEIPARKLAAIRYSGAWSQKRYETHKAKLLNFIRQKERKIIGEPIFARYDPPFQLWFLRRNEVLIPIQ
jgi:effector-binding domain-containing protein